MQKIMLLVALLSLTACGESNQGDESEQAAEPDQTVIELENSDETDKMAEINYFNQNPAIDSEVYREFFSTTKLLGESSMESDIEGDSKVAEGNLMPIGTDNLSVPRYMNYTFNMSEEKLDLALILTEGTMVKEKELTEAVFVHLEYDKKNDTLINIIQENTSGETVEHVNLTEEEWIEVAEESIQFVDRIHPH